MVFQRYYHKPGSSDSLEDYKKQRERVVTYCHSDAEGVAGKDCSDAEGVAVRDCSTLDLRLATGETLTIPYY